MTACGSADDPRGVAATAENLRQQITALERSQTATQRQSQQVIARNSEQLGALLGKLEELRGALSAQHTPPPLPPTAHEAEQLRTREAETHELRRRCDTQREVVRRKQSELRELEIDIASLRRLVAGAELPSAQLAGVSTDAGLATVNAERTSAVGQRPLGLRAAEAAAAERVECAVEQRRVLEHMAARLRKERSEFDGRFDAVQERVGHEEKRVQSLASRVARARQLREASEGRLRQLERGMATAQGAERSELGRHEALLSGMRANMEQSQLSGAIANSGGTLAGIASAAADSTEAGAAGVATDDTAWVSEAAQQQVHWESLQKKLGMREPVELLQRAQALMRTKEQLATFEGQAFRHAPTRHARHAPACPDTPRHAPTRHDPTRPATTRHDTPRHATTRHDTPRHAKTQPALPHPAPPNEGASSCPSSSRTATPYSSSLAGCCQVGGGSRPKAAAGRLEETAD